MFMRQATLLLSITICGQLMFIPTAYSTVAPVTIAQQASTTSSATNSNLPKTPPLRQNQPSTPLPPTLLTLQQKHKQELANKEQRLSLLEQANQEALAKNQQLQMSNDSLSGQLQVLQSERSAQMFLYGAVTFGVGLLFGIILYSVLYTRRRRSW